MNCYNCDTELTWGGDHDYEDYGIEGSGIVTNLTCPNCETYVLVHTPSDLKTKANRIDKLNREL